MIRILHVIGTLANGGMESFLLNLYRHVDRSRIQFDFVVGSQNGWCQSYADEIRNLGGEIYTLPAGLKGIRAFQSLLLQHPDYQIIHCHRDAMSTLFLLVARFVGRKLLISHSHSASETGWVKQVATVALLPLLNKLALYRLACGREAGEHLYHGYAYRVIPNAIDLSAFTYKQERAEIVRRNLGFFPDDLVIGHVGRFEKVKNHSFLLDVFSRLHTRDPRMKLLLVGSGSLKEAMVHQVEALGLHRSVVFLEQRTDIPDLLQAMDLVVFPSFYEGFSMAMVEMQAAGLRILASDQIPQEVNITGSVTFKSLKDGSEQWAQAASSLLAYRREAVPVHKLYEYGLDIHESARAIQQFYEQVQIEFQNR